MINTAGTFYKANGGTEIKDGVGFINSPTKKDDGSQPISFPKSENSFKKKRDSMQILGKASEAKGFTPPASLTRAPSEAQRLTGDTPRQSQGYAKRTSGDGPRLSGGMALKFAEDSPTKSQGLSETEPTPVNALQLLGFHIGKMGGEMPKLRDGDRWKLKRMQSKLEKQIKANQDLDDDWE